LTLSYSIFLVGIVWLVMQFLLDSNTLPCREAVQRLLLPGSNTQLCNLGIATTVSGLRCLTSFRLDKESVQQSQQDSSEPPDKHR